MKIPTIRNQIYIGATYQRDEDIPTIRNQIYIGTTYQRDEDTYNKKSDLYRDDISEGRRYLQ